MPKFPDFAERVDMITGSVFEKFLPKMRQQGENLVRLHIGDTYLPPTYELPLRADFTEAHPLYNRYCNTFGVYELRKTLADKVREDNRLPVTWENIMMTCGATNALSVSMMGLVNPGEEVLILTPAWPFFFGMVRIAGGVGVEVPVYIRLYEQPDMNVADYLSQFITSRTVALYVNTPNNPSGKVLQREHLEQIVQVARQHRLWIISDEAYDGMTYDQREHISIAAIGDAYEQTISIFTFSKVYMFAGLRLGYVAADEKVLANINKMIVHQLYSPSTLAQYMMIEPVKTRHQWGGEFIRHCHELRDLFTKNLKLKHFTPEGAYYLFFSIKDYLRGRDYWQAIDDCLDSGVSVAPGKDFGKDFHDYIRICFAGEPPERLAIAVERLNRIFG